MANNRQERDRYGRDRYDNDGNRPLSGDWYDESRYGTEFERPGYDRDFPGAGYAERAGVVVSDPNEVPMRSRSAIGAGYPEGRWGPPGYRPPDGRDFPGEGYVRTGRRRAGDEQVHWHAYGNGDYREYDQGHRGRGPKNYTRSDERIREDVSDRLLDDRHIDASDIEVTVSDSEVTLDGTVTEKFAKRHAEDLADDVAGVQHVQNNLRVDAEKAQAGAPATGTVSVPEVKAAK